ncbi:MAG: hypothetical protein V4492_05015 [Chlamydiota bacterium]
MKKHLPLTHALAWIIGSVFVITGPSYAYLKYWMKQRVLLSRDPGYALRSLIQTGPQKEALKTEYLAELLGLSSDAPPSALLYNPERAKEALLQSPLISRAEVKILKPDTLYVDYTVRQPLAFLEDFENVALDKEAYPFPFSPFFTPKNLPAIYLGVSAFGTPSLDPDRPIVQWGKPLMGKYSALAMHVLSIVQESNVADLFNVQRIDVSNAYSESYGTREIVLVVQDTLIQNVEGRLVQFAIPRILRLSTKNYAQELGNYLKLRPQMLEEERKRLPTPAKGQMACQLKEKVIDFRIDQLAFIR